MNEIAELVIARVVPRGDGFAHWRGRAVFVPNTAPGDHVRVRIEGVRRGVLRARVLAFLARGKVGAEPFCPHAASCGGCALQWIARKYWPFLKASWVEAAFRPFLQAGARWRGVAIPTGPRRRVVWHGDGRHLGFFGRGSHRLVVPEPCPVVEPRLSAFRAAAEARGWARARSVQAVALQDGVYLVGDAKGLAPVQGASCWAGRPLRALAHARMLAVALPTPHGEIRVEVPPGAFVQATRRGLATMVKTILRWCAGATRVGDLYCGFGALSLPLAAAGAEVVGADADQAAVTAGNKTARRLGLHARYFAMDLAKAPDLQAFAGMDVLIVDPPRAGARVALRMLGRLVPQRLVLVHCDMAAAAQDARVVASCGYRLRELVALDLFPGAGHVEALSLWALE